MQRLFAWLFGPPARHEHQFGPVQDTPFGYGRQCSECLLWEWLETTGEANARYAAALRDWFERQ